MRTLHGARSRHPHLRRCQNEQHSLLHGPIGHNPQPRQPAAGVGVLRACLPRHGGALLPQRRVDRLRRHLRHRPNLGDPQRVRSQERVSGPLGSDRRPPMVLRWDEDRRLWGRQGQVLRSRLYVTNSLFLFPLLIKLFYCSINFSIPFI